MYLPSQPDVNAEINQRMAQGRMTAGLEELVTCDCTWAKSENQGTEASGIFSKRAAT